MEALGKYCGDLQIACGRAKLLVSVLVAGWLLFPVAVVTMFYPTDAIGFQHWMEHDAVPRFYTWHMATVGFFEAAAATFIGLSPAMFLATVLFFRRAKFFVKLWPVPGVLVGVIANGFWWLDTGFFDRPGALAGLASLVLMVICEAICEHLGADFVFGKDNRPSRDEESSWA